MARKVSPSRLEAALPARVEFRNGHFRFTRRPAYDGREAPFIPANYFVLPEALMAAEALVFGESPQADETARPFVEFVFRNALVCGAMVAFVRDENGVERRIPQHSWALDGWEQTCTSGRMTIARGQVPGFTRKQDAWVIIPGDHVVQVFKPAPVRNAETTPPPPAAAPERRSFSISAVRSWYENDWIPERERVGRIPSRVQDLEAAQKKFGAGVTHAFIRALRKELAPPGWKRHGRRAIASW